MNKTSMITKNAVLSVGLLILLGSVGCGQNMKSSESGATAVGSSSAGGNQEPTPAPTVVDVSAQLKAANDATKTAEMAIAEAQSIVDTLTDKNGNINIGLFTKSTSSTVQAKGILSGVVDKLRPVFDKVLSKAQLVKDQFAKARGLLADAMAKLDPKDANQAAQIQLIRDSMKQIDQLEARFSTAMHKLAGQLDKAVLALDKLISRATNFIPGWGWVVDLAIDWFVMDDVRTLIDDVKMKLLSF